MENKNKNDFFNISFVNETMISSLLDMSKYYDNLDISERKNYLYLVRLSRKNRVKTFIYYNYIGYYKLFHNSLLCYIITRHDFKNSLIFKEWGDHICFIDKKFFPKIEGIEGIDDIAYYDKILKIYNEYQNENSKSFVANNWNDVEKKQNFCMDIKGMSEIIRACILGGTESYYSLREYGKYDLNLHDVLERYKIWKCLEKDMLFVVSDINSLVDFVNNDERNKYFKLIMNQGTQSNRGQLNSLSQFLSIMDLDYRNKLYENYITHNNDTRLNRTKFNFKNIHIKSLNVKYYSTQSNVSPYNNKHPLLGFPHIKYFSSTTRVKKIYNIPIWLDILLFPNDFNMFKKRLISYGKLKLGVNYSVIPKIFIDDKYRSIGTKQEHFKFNSHDDDKPFDKLYEYINNRLDYLESNPSDSNIDYKNFDGLLLEFFPTYVSNDLKKTNIELLKSKITKTQYDIVKKSFNYFGDYIFDINGKSLNFNFSDTKLYIDDIKSIEGFNEFEQLFFDKFKCKHKDYILNTNSKLYVVVFQKKSYIIILNKVGDIEVNKYCFNKYAQLIDKCKDTKVKFPSGSFGLRRETSNIVTLFNSNNELLMINKKLVLSPIKSEYYINSDTSAPNTNIGVLDLETYEDNGIAKCFAIGFYSTLDKKCKTFYINKDLDSNELIKRCFDEMLRPKYKDTTFYAHNLGKYDSIFLPKSLYSFNNENNIYNNYYATSVNRNSDILRLVIKKKIEGKTRTLKIQDSLAILPRSLRDLSIDYNLDITKGFLPYTFITNNTLFYLGKTPDISYYRGGVNITENEYKELYKEKWDLQQETIKYLEKDLLSLQEVLIKVCKSSHLLFDIQLVDHLTISGISMSIFLNKYYKIKEKPLPLINNKTMFDDLHNGYYGGRVEVFNPIPDKGSFYYDVNSLYPFASLLPLPGINCEYLEYHLQKPILSDLFGFFYCKIKTNNNYFGLLPKRTEDGRLSFPLGEWKGWYFSEELKFAQDNGYEIEVLKGYSFDKVFDVFKDFVNDVYKIKSNPRNKTEKNVSKLILNSLIGRFGMDFFKRVTKLVDSKEHNHLITTRVVKDTKKIDYNLYLICYLPNINRKICEDFGVDFVKALNYENYDEVKRIKSYKNVSLSTAAAVLSYARIHMAKIMLYILNNGGTIYYTDTDSIVTNIKLPDQFVDKNMLGKLKLEYIIKKGFFISDKTYTFKTVDDKLIKKAKSVNSSFLTYEDYEKMYNMEIIKNAVRSSTVKDITKGSVLIKTRSDIHLNNTIYKKRERVFENGKWVGTKPIVINIELEKNNH